MQGGAIVRAGGRDVYVELYHDRDRRMWYGSWDCSRGIRAAEGKTRDECLASIRRDAMVTT